MTCARLRAGRAPRASRRGITSGERGSTSIELVGIVTMLVIVTWLCVQGLVITQVGSSVEHAARDGARAGSIPGRSVTDAVEAQLPSWTHVESIRTGSAAVPGCGGSCVRVEVSVPISLPGITVSTFRVARDAEMPRS